MLGSFNRGIKHDARALIARAYGEEFGVAPPYPESFAGVPVLNNLNSWFISLGERARRSRHRSLWDLCRAAVDYAADATEETRERLVDSVRCVRTGGTRKLTMGIYWIRPQTFAAYDSTNTTFLKKRFPELAATLSLNAKINGEQFLANTETLAVVACRARVAVQLVPRAFHAAWNDLAATAAAASAPSPRRQASQYRSLPATAAGVAGEAYDVDSIRDDGCFLPAAELEPMIERLRSRKNIILQGPPGTGKTWLARRLGVGAVQRARQRPGPGRPVPPIPDLRGLRAGLAPRWQGRARAGRRAVPRHVQPGHG